MAVTNRLRLWRADHGLTLEEVSGLTGLSPAMLSRVERGERRLAPLTKVKVARCLGVAVGEVFDPEQELEEARKADPGQITAHGGFSVPITAGPYFDRRWFDYLTKAQELRGWRRWLTWDKGWGFPLQGSVPTRLRDQLPVFRAQRGGIRFAIPGDPPR